MGSKLFARNIGQNYWLERSMGNWSQLLVGTVNGRIGQNYWLEQIVIGQIG